MFAYTVRKKKTFFAPVISLQVIHNCMFMNC